MTLSKHLKIIIAKLELGIKLSFADKRLIIRSGVRNLFN